MYISHTYHLPHISANHLLHQKLHWLFTLPYSRTNSLHVVSDSNETKGVEVTSSLIYYAGLKDIGNVPSACIFAAVVPAHIVVLMVYVAEIVVVLLFSDGKSAYYEFQNIINTGDKKQHQYDRPFVLLRLSLADIVHNPRLTDPDIASNSFDRETVSTGFLNPYTYLCLRCICGGMDLMIGLTLWNEMASNFDIRTYEQMEKPFMIVVASCCVTRYNGLPLSWTSATHYYLNPNIPETYQIREMHTQATDATPILDVQSQRHEQEKTRNHFPLAVLLEVDPQNYQRVRFTTEATIYKINSLKPWYYQKCAACGQKVQQQPPFPMCKDHGPQTKALYSYCFKAIVGDGSGTVSITCFSDQANSLIR
ncbi:nucleic acid-binding, OB-fold protein [Tanacetum coccineum]